MGQGWLDVLWFSLHWLACLYGCDCFGWWDWKLLLLPECSQARTQGWADACAWSRIWSTWSSPFSSYLGLCFADTGLRSCNAWIWDNSFQAAPFCDAMRVIPPCSELARNADSSSSCSCRYGIKSQGALRQISALLWATVYPRLR